MTDNKLPLVLRKNIKENEANLKEHMATINTAVGKTWTFEVDFAKINSNTEIREDLHDRLGEVIYSSYLENLATGIKSFCEHPMNKEALASAVTKNKIMYRLNAAAEPLCNEFKIEDGVLILQSPPKYFWSNLSEVYSLNLDKILDTDKSKFSLITRKNLAQYEPKLKEHEANINAALGTTDWKLEFDIAKLMQAPTIKQDAGREGEIFYDSYAERIEECIKKNCEDDLTKEELVNQITKKKIALCYVDKTQNYHDFVIKDGALILQCKPENVWINMSDVSYYKLDKLL